MKKNYSSLTSLGNIQGVEHTMDSLLLCYITNKASQSILDRGKTISLAGTYGRYANHPDQFRSKVTEDLEALFNEYFDSLSVTTKLINSEDKFDVEVSIRVVVDGKNYDLNKALTSIDSRVVEIFRGN